MSIQETPQEISIPYNNQRVRVHVNRNNPDEQFVVFLPEEKIILNLRTDVDGNEIWYEQGAKNSARANELGELIEASDG